MRNHAQTWGMFECVVEPRRRRTARLAVCGAAFVAATCVLTVACAGTDATDTRSATGSTPAPVPAPATSATTTTTTLRPTGLAPHTAYAPDTVPPEPAALAAELETVEARLRNPDLDGETRRALAHRQQAAYRIIAENPQVRAATVAAVDAPNRAAVERNAGAAVEAREITPAQPELPAWKIIPPAPADDLLAAYKQTEAATGVPWQYLAAINLIETRMGRIRGTSTAGAQGPMQFIPSTWAEYGAGGDINDPADAIMAAGRLLAANGGGNDIDNALFRYNPTEHYVRAVKAYAENIAEDSTRYLAYYDWRVYYLHTSGTIVLEEGYEKPA